MGKQRKMKMIFLLLMSSLVMGNVFPVAANTVDTEYDLIELDMGQTKSDELIADGDFEKGGSAWNQGKNKSIASGVSYGDGTHSGMLPSNNGNSYIGQIVNVTPNKEYTIKAYIKTNADDAKVNLCVRGGTNAQLQANSGTVLFDEKYGGSEWTPVEATFNSGSHSSILISLVKWEENTSSNAYRNAAYIDNVSIKEAKPELIANGNFENGNNSWKMIGTSTISNNMWDGQYIAYEGQYYGMLPSQTNNASLYQTLELKANTTYVLKAKVAVQTGGEVIFAVKSPDLSSHYSGGAIEKKIEGTGLEWVDFEYEFTTKTQTSVGVAFIKWSDTNSGGVYDGQVYIDNVSLKEVSKDIEEPKDENYNIIWADDFNDTKLDNSKWGYELGSIRGVEQQHYTNSEENVFMRDGKLVLKATDRALEDQYKNPRGNRQVIYDSGSVRTHGKYEFLYGRIEMKAKLPKGKGVFPAFWTLGADFVLDGRIDSKQGYGWARCGEIDIMELTGTESGAGNRTVWQTIHTDDGLNEDNGKLAGQGYTISEDFYNDYHIFGINWSENKVEWYVDDQIVCTADYSDTSIAKNRIAQKALNRPQYIQMNLAMGGNWPGDAGTNLAGTEFLIDYVYYARNNEQQAAADAYYASAPQLNGLKNITMIEGDTPDLLKEVTTSKGYFVDYSVENEPMFTNVGGCTSVDLLCHGKDDIDSLANLPVGTYNIHYSAIPNNVEYKSNHVPDGTKDYKFARRTMTLTVEERKFPTEYELRGKKGETLSTITLPEGWSWQNGQEVLNNDNETYNVVHESGKVVEVNVQVRDFSKLNDLVNEAKEKLINQADYVSSTISDLKDVLSQAKELLQTYPSQDKITEMESLVQDKMNSLQLLADKTQLKTLYDEVKEYDESKYTADSWEVFSKALKDAKAVLNKETATQNEVEASVLELQNAIKGLKEVVIEQPNQPVEPNIPQTPVQPDDKETPQEPIAIPDDEIEKDVLGDKIKLDNKQVVDKKENKKVNSAKTNDPFIIVPYAILALCAIGAYITIKKIDYK